MVPYRTKGQAKRQHRIKRQYRIKGLLALGLALVVLTGGCNLLPQNPFSRGTPEEEVPVATDESFVGEAQTIIRASSDRIQVTLPANWQEDQQLHPSADIEASRRAADLYLIVLAESKTEIGNSFSLEDASVLYRNSFIEGLTDVSQVITDTPSVQGYNAIQYRIDAISDGTNVIALHTTVETSQSYYQIIAWTKATLYGNYAEELQGAINGFQVLNQG